MFVVNWRAGEATCSSAPSLIVDPERVAAILDVRGKQERKGGA